MFASKLHPRLYDSGEEFFLVITKTQKTWISITQNMSYFGNGQWTFGSSSIKATRSGWGFSLSLLTEVDA